MFDKRFLSPSGSRFGLGRILDLEARRNIPAPNVGLESIGGCRPLRPLREVSSLERYLRPRKGSVCMYGQYGIHVHINNFKPDLQMRFGSTVMTRASAKCWRKTVLTGCGMDGDQGVKKDLETFS